jgi:hypothetical protein
MNIKKGFFFNLIAIPYTLVFSYFAWDIFFKDMIQDLRLIPYFMIVFIVYFSPYLYFISKGNNEILNFILNKIKNLNSVVSLINIIFIFGFLSITWGFYIGVIGKIIGTEGLISFLKYSFLPPLFVIYLLPFACYSYTNNKESFNQGIRNFFNSFLY